MGSGLSAAWLTMSGARFEGVVDRPTANGPRRYLKLSMDKVEIVDGEHWSRHHAAIIRQAVSEMTMSGGVVMYATRLRARIAGVRLTFTPDVPPLLLPPSVTVTGVELDQVVVHAASAGMDGLEQQVSAPGGRPGRPPWR